MGYFVEDVYLLPMFLWCQILRQVRHFLSLLRSTRSGSERAGNGLESPYIFSHGRYVEERYSYGRSSFFDGSSQRDS